MPIYEYQCKACGHQFEAMQKMSEPVLRDCPQCQQPELQKLVSAPAFHLKGSGWYVTDFKNKDNKPSTKNAADDTTKASTSQTSSAPAEKSSETTTPSDKPLATEKG